MCKWLVDPTCAWEDWHRSKSVQDKSALREAMPRVGENKSLERGRVAAVGGGGSLGVPKTQVSLWDPSGILGP